MKIKTLLVVALMGIVATACEKDDVTSQEDMTVKTPITISANYGGHGAKVAYTEEGANITAKWETGDKLYVVYNGVVNTLTLDEGAGTSSATFTGTISGTPSATSMLLCYVKDKNAPSAVTVNTDGSYTYTDGTFTSQDGTLASAAKCNLYYGVATYGDGSDISCTFSVNTSMMKFHVATGLAENTAVTLSYKSNGTTIASASFNVGADGTNTVYMAIPAGKYTGTQTLVCNDGMGNYYSNATATLSATQANFAAGETYSKPFVFLFSGTGAVTATDGAIITGYGSQNSTHLTIADGATVVLENAKLPALYTVSNNWAGITCLGDAKIILIGTNQATGYGPDYPGIYVPDNKTLTIEGAGSLSAECQGQNIGRAAGIGSGNNLPSGNIVINSGTISAKGYNGGAGIGAATWGSCGTITINGGTITAVNSTNAGGGSGAGIGSGVGLNSVCAGITINGGTIIANGGSQAAGIGTGKGGSCTNGVTIGSGVTSVTASKGNNGTNIIGAGSDGTCGTVTIDGIEGASTSSAFTHFNSSLSNSDMTWTLTRN